MISAMCTSVGRRRSTLRLVGADVASGQQVAGKKRPDSPLGSGDVLGDGGGGVAVEAVSVAVVAHGGRGVGVAGEVPHVTQGGAGVQGGGDRRVSQAVRGHPPGDAGRGSDLWQPTTWNSERSRSARPPIDGVAEAGAPADADDEAPRTWLQAAAGDPDVAELARRRTRQRFDHYQLAATRIAELGGPSGPTAAADGAAAIWAIGHPRTYDLLMGDLGWSHAEHRRWVLTSLRRQFSTDTPT
jgi:hypothetical protein